MQVQKGCLVSLRFTMYSMDGDVLGSTEGQFASLHTRRNGD